MKSIFIIVLSTLLITGCSMTQPKQDVTLLATSQHWQLTIHYEHEKEGYVEHPEIQYIGSAPIQQVHVAIRYDSNSKTTDNIELPVQLNHHEKIKLVTQTIVQSWKHTKSVHLDWTLQTGAEKSEEIDVSRK